MSYEKQGTAHDPHAAGYELHGRDKAPLPSMQMEVVAHSWRSKGVTHFTEEPPSARMPVVAHEPLVTLSQAQSALAAMQVERDEAQAAAYRASLDAIDRLAELDKANERANKNWRDFRDLRIEITGDGPMCRDCADENGRCPHSGQPCDPDEAVKEQIAKWKADGFRDKVALGATADEILRFRDGYPNPSGGSKIIYRYTIEQARYLYADAVIAARSTAIKENGNG